MSIYYKQSDVLFKNSEDSEIIQMIHVDAKHPFVVASGQIDWQKLFLELNPVLYKGIRKFLGRKLDLRAHCGIFILQASHNWTDRFSEEMLRYYAPVRIFCGYVQNSTKSIDHTKIEKFRNRLGKEGAEILNKYLLNLAKKHNFTNGKQLDTDTTVQEAGISYPADLNLMKKLRERAIHIASKILGKSSSKIRELKVLENAARKMEKVYRFFTHGKNVKEQKRKLISKLRKITEVFVDDLVYLSKKPRMTIENIKPALQKELNHLSKIGRTLLFQIKYWLATGNVATGKILSLYKSAPRYIGKGKIGKAYEIGRKFIVNQFHGGFLSVLAPENPIIADSDTLIMALRQSFDIFGELPNSIGADRIYSTKKNIRLLKLLKTSEIGLQPKGQKDWEVDRETAQKLYCRRAAIEPRIGIAGRLGLKKSRAKTDAGDVISGYKAAVGFNFKKLMVCWAR